MVLGEGYEPYHVPQQSRRDKLRVGNHHSDNHHHQQHFLLYDHDPPSSSNFLACTDNKANSVTVAKEGGLNFMGFVGRQHQYPYLDPHSSNNSFPINPSSSSIQDITSDDPFLYTSHNLQNYKDFGHPYNGSNSTSSAVQGLSLSLSSHDQTHRSNYHVPLELNLQQRYNGSTAINYGDNMVPGIVGGHHVGSSASNQVVVSRRSSVPLGPFTGYASILKGSRFLKPAQQLLEEICVVGWGMYSEVKITEDDASNLINDPSIESLNDNASGLIMDAGEISQRKKSSLISMLNEVYRRYKQYYQQMQAVVESFEGVAGLGTAAPFAYLALKAMSKHFRALKNAITDQLQFTDKAYGQLSHGKEAARSANIDRGLHCQRPVQNSGFSEHQPVWRPQRGLPERAVTVLRAWLFEHFLHPYPTDTDKLMLAKQTGLTRSQVSNWFINARVRLWKPMVEEIHKLETRQALGHSEMEEENANRSSDQVSMSNSALSDNSLTSSRRVQDIPSKRTRNEFPDLPEEPLNLSYNSLSSNPHMGGGVSMTGRSSGVSLALGLHQNNGIGLLEPFPINAAQRFGLEPNGEAYVMDGFEAQNRHLGRDIIGLHNFVG